MSGSLRPLYTNTAAQNFRAIIKPSLQGSLLQVEGRLAGPFADTLEVWLRSVISETIATTRLKDPKGYAYQQMRQTMKIFGRGSLSQLRGVIYGYPWLVAQEFGAHITPKKTKFLAIPMFYALRADGSPKFRSAYSWQRFGSFVYTNRETGAKYLAYKGADGSLRILYLLVEWVNVKAVLGLNATADKMIGQLIGQWGNIWVDEMLRSGLMTLWGFQ